MVAFPRIQGLTGSLSTIGGVLAAALTAATFTLVPRAVLEAWVWNSGIAALVPAAAPPLAVTARAVLALGGGAVAGALGWSALYLLWGPGGFLAPRTAKIAREGGVPAVRRADAHPDAPPRRPMSAADLGTPLMEVTSPPVERPLPADLDQPLAAFDPGAIPASPMPAPVTLRTVDPAGALPIVADAVAPSPTAAEPALALPVVAEPEQASPTAAEPAAPLPVAAEPAPVPPRAPSLAPGERMQTFQLAPVVRFGSEVPPETRPAASLDALLRRLEAGAGRRAAQG